METFPESVPEFFPHGLHKIGLHPSGEAISIGLKPEVSEKALKSDCDRHAGVY